MLKLIIFDLDGVIVDTEKNMRHSWEYVKKKYKINKNFTDYKKKNWSSISRYFRRIKY